MFSRILYAQQPVTKNLHISPRFSPTIFYREANSVILSTPLYSSINRLYAQNPVFAIIHDDESVKVYLHMYNGNFQQNPLCVESCVTNELSISPRRLWRTISHPDANSVLLREHLCTAVGTMRRKPCVRNCSREVKVCTTGMSSRTLYAQHPVSLRIFSSLPGYRLPGTIFYRDANSVLLLNTFFLCTAVLLINRLYYRSAR